MDSSTGICVCLLLGLGLACAQFDPFISVDHGLPDNTERWGFADVDEGAHMFWWLYKTYHFDGYLNKPWIIWLQGGPGSDSSGFGNFELLGPLDLNLNAREHTWVNEVSVVFVDNPVGSGWSYVDTADKYTTTNLEIALELVGFTKAFLQNYPEFQTLPLYIFGESYGGKMGAEFAYELHKAIGNGELTCNLKGMANGNAWLSPIDSVLEWGPHTHYMGNLDEVGLADMKSAAGETQAAIDAGDWEGAQTWWGITENVLFDHTNDIDIYNILKYRTSSKNINEEYQLTKSREHLREHLEMAPILYNTLLAPLQRDELDDLMNGPIRDKLEIISPDFVFGEQGGMVFQVLKGDFMKPVIDILSAILVETDIELSIYEGNLDIICLTEGAMRVVDQMDWPNKNSYINAVRLALEDAETGQTDIFVKSFDKFKFYWVVRAGHMVPADYPLAARKLLTRVVTNTDV